MEQKTAGGVRARVRAEMIAEIKAAARRHLATDGANLSLRAIARDMGMVSSALYRYVASRDDLLTALIIDAYNEMGEVAEKADASVDPGDPPERWMAVARALRRWALTNPAEYALLYGTPVPGYAAPTDTTAPATRPVLVLGAILSAAVSSGGSAAASGGSAGASDGSAAASGGSAAASGSSAVSSGGSAAASGVSAAASGSSAVSSGGSAAASGDDAGLGPALRAEIRGIADLASPGVDDRTLVRGLIGWTMLFGALNFELFGRIDNAIDERDEWFDVQMRAMVHYIGLR